MKTSRLFKKACAVSVAFMLLFTAIPALTGSLEADASSYPTYTHFDGDCVGSIGGFCYYAKMVDSDSPRTSLKVDIYLDTKKVASQNTDQSGRIEGFIKSTNYGRHQLKFKVFDVNSSGVQTGNTYTYDGPSITIYTVSDFVSSDIEVYSANCQSILGSVPLSNYTTVYVSTAPDSGFMYLGLEEVTWYGRYRTTDERFLKGTVYLTVTCDDGTNTKKIVKEVKVEDHTFDSGTVTKPAKYFSQGEKTFTCSRCGATKTTSIPKLDIAKVKPAKVKITSAKVNGRTLTLKWKKIGKKTKGYQIGLKDKKSGMTKYTNVKQGKKSTIKKTIKKLERGRKYAIKVRAYNIVEGHKVYGPWSKAKSGKV